MNKKNFFNLMTMLLVALLSAGFAACSSDDDEDEPTPTPTPTPSGELVTDKTPALGWSADKQDGIVTFCEYITENTEEDIQPFYALELASGQCKDAVYNIVCPNERLAQQFEDVLKNGDWAEALEDEDDYAPLRKALLGITTRVRDLNYKDLGLPAKRKGKVVYFNIDCFKGKTLNDIKYLVNFWAGKTQAMPNQVVVGTWDEGKGLYKNNFVFGLGIVYDIQATFQNDFLVKLTGKMSCPNATWAQLMYEAVLDEYEDMADEYDQIETSVTVNGKVVNAVADIEPGTIPKSYVKQMMAMYDISYSYPVFCLF